MTTRKQQQAASKQSQQDQKNNGSELGCSNISADNIEVEAIEGVSDFDSDAVESLICGYEEENAENNGESLKKDTKISGINETTLLLKTIFSMAAMIGGEHWILEPSEEELLASPLDEVLEKYFPNMGRNFGCEFSLALAAFMVVQPRIQITRELKAEAEEAEQVEQTIEAEQTSNPKDEFQGVPM